MSCVTSSLYIHNWLSWQTNDWSKTSLFSHWHQSQLACTSAKVEEKKCEMLCKSVKDKQNRTNSHVFLNSNEWSLFYRMYISVQCTDYIPTYIHHFLFVPFLPFVVKPNTYTHTHTHRPWVKSEIVERSGPKVSNSGSRSPANEAYQATLTRTLSSNSMTSPSTTSDSASPLLYLFDSPPRISVFRSVSSISLSLSLSLSLFFSVLILAVSVSLCSCVFLLLFFFFFWNNQLEYHCQTEKGVQQSKREKLNTVQTKHILPGQREPP